jgi:hypothetical protein
VWGVLFTDQGLIDLGEVLKPYLSTGRIGKYLYCEQVEMDLPYYIRIIVETTTSDGTSSDFEIHVPHHYVKSVVAATEQKTLGFV